MRNDLRASWLLAAAVAAISMLSLTAGAAETESAAPAATASADGEPVRRAATAYRAAIAKGDLDAIGAFWTPQADFIDQSGRVYKVHAGIERAKRGAQESAHLAHLSPRTETLEIRFVTPDVAIEDGTFERSGVEEGQSPHGRYSAVWVKRGGHWLIDGLRESPARVENSADALKGLAWIIGDWSAETAQVTAEIHCSWGQDNSYIIAHMKLQPKGEKAITGTQLIGWDPLQSRVHSFLIDSRGAYTEGVWADEGDAWTVKATTVLPNGTRTTSTKLYSRIDENTAVWESIDDDHAGQPGIDIRLRLQRKPAVK